ncbi:MAG: VWA domain-containing protein [Hyphomonadaceae bacterium]
MHRRTWMKSGLVYGAASLALLVAACETSPPDAATVPEAATDTAEADTIIVTGSKRVEGDEEAAPPPPPPSPVAAARSRAVLGEGLSEARSSSDITYKPVPVPPLDGPRPQPAPQSGLLTAGDYDDVLNPDLYKAYLDKTLQAGGDARLPYVDAADRIAVRVTDRLGKPLPFADVALTTAQGEEMFPLRTGANGTVYLYPAFDALSAGTQISVSVDGGNEQTRTLSQNLLDTGGTLPVIISADAAKVQKLDVLLTLDATGSMSDEMAYLQTELTSIMTRMERANPELDIRAGLIVYRDKGDEYVIRDFDFTGDLDAFKNTLAQQEANGGGDFPEAMHTAQERGLGLSWRDDAIKVNLLVADAPPHDADITATWETALHARVRGIHTVPIAASGVDPKAEFLMRAMGQVTGGRYLFLTDDSGVGNPHAEPTVDCYIVTPLNSLVQRVLESLVLGRRVEPSADIVVRTVGNYQAGVCNIDDASNE